MIDEQMVDIRFNLSKWIISTCPCSYSHTGTCTFPCNCLQCNLKCRCTHTPDIGPRMCNHIVPGKRSCLHSFEQGQLEVTVERFHLYERRLVLFLRLSLITNVYKLSSHLAYYQSCIKHQNIMIKVEKKTDKFHVEHRSSLKTKTRLPLML